MGTQPDEVTGDDARVDELAADIDETREDLADTVRQIGTRLEPANVVREARDTVAGVAMGKVEMMSIGAQETWRDVRTGNAGSLLDMVRENPIPAAMVGVGLAAMLMSRGSQGDRMRDRMGRARYYDGRAYDRYGYAMDSDWYGSAGNGSPMDRVGSMAENARSAVGDAADTVSQSMGQMADSVGQSMGQVAGSVGQMASDLPQQAGAMVDYGASQARRMLDENPLGAGIIAMAAGAALGMLLPTTSFERETVGPMRDQVVDQAATAAEEAIRGAGSSSQQGSTWQQGSGSSQGGGSGIG